MISAATQNRQDAVKKLVKLCDLVVVVGSRTVRIPIALCEVARNECRSLHG
ncbi:MAG: hypothetical protein P0107_04175 [Nitrosomonas sp.]|nr:hypothetical protein [Nitrosomonas sp.]